MGPFAHVGTYIKSDEAYSPPGDVYCVEATTVFVREQSGDSFTKQEGKRVILRECRDLHARFGEVVFAR